jgi:hypothetical protein
MKADPYYEGQEAYWNGTRCPYDSITQPDQYSEWNRGWRSEDIREICKEDSYS